MYNWTIIYFEVRNDTNHRRLIEETIIVVIVIATIKKKKEKNQPYVLSGWQTISSRDD